MEEIKNNFSGTYSWIKKFEKQTNGKGKPLPVVLKRNNINWYTMLDSSMGELVTSINPEDRIFIAKIENLSFVNQRLIRFNRVNDEVDLELCHALMNSLIGMFFIESLGFGRGEGALDLNTTKLRESLYILNPSLLNENSKQEILNKFKILKQREIKNLKDEILSDDRQEFDDVVLSAYKILEYKEQIKNTLLCLYKIRKSVKA